MFDVYELVMSRGLVGSLWRQRPSGPLYHYTSAEGLLGIVSSKSLWASGIQYLNDTAEFKHAESISRTLLSERLGDETDPRKGLYDILRGGLPLRANETVFVGSLSEAKDKLSQWRAYCPNGGGFSVGFDPQLVLRRAETQGFHLLKCEYDPERQRALCAELISEGCRARRE
jgi:hypothetical protein